MGTWHKFGGVERLFGRTAAAVVTVGLVASSIAYTAAPNAASKGGKNAAAPAAAAGNKKAPAKAAPAATPSPFKSLPVDESQAKRRSDVTRMLRAQTFQAGEDKLFDTYYLTYAFPRWTLPENLSSIAKFRTELRSELYAGRSGAPYTRLVNLTLNFLTPIVNDRSFHPAVRYNAMAAIGDLDVSLPPPGAPSDQRGTQPVPAALDLMLAVLQDPAQIDAVRIAALQGLVRHAGLPMADTQKRDQQVLPLLLQWASTKDPPSGRTKVGHAWMRALAIEALGALGLPGANGQVVKTLAAVLTESDTPLITRLAAAKALGKLQYKGLTAIKPQEVVIPLVQFMLEAMTAEARRPLVLAASAATGTPGMPGMYPGMTPTPTPTPGMPGMTPGYAPAKKKGGKAPKTPPGMYYSEETPGMYPGMPGIYPGMPGMAPGAAEEQADERAVIFRRRLKTVLHAVQSALGRDTTGLKSWAADTPDAPLVALVEKHVNDQIRDLDDEESPVDSLKKKMAEHRKTVRSFLDDPAQAVAAYEAELQAKASRKK